MKFPRSAPRRAAAAWQSAATLLTPLMQRLRAIEHGRDARGPPIVTVLLSTRLTEIDAELLILDRPGDMEGRNLNLAVVAFHSSECDRQRRRTQGATQICLLAVQFFVHRIVWVWTGYAPLVVLLRAAFLLKSSAFPLLVLTVEQRGVAHFY